MRHEIVAADTYPHRTAEYNPIMTWVRSVICCCGEIFREKDDGRFDHALIEFRAHRDKATGLSKEQP